MDETKFIGMGCLMAAEVLKEDTDARGDQFEVCPLTELAELPETPEEYIWHNDPVTIEVECHITRLQLYSLLAGRKITNNWLKLHGRAMVRKPVKHYGKAVAKIG